MGDCRRGDTALPVRECPASCRRRHTWGMAWEVEFTEEFQQWWDSLGEDEDDDVALSVRHLVEFGPALGFPHSSKVVTSRSNGKPLRTLYAFNPLRTAVLLIGGDKSGDDRWYETFVPIADKLFAGHLNELRKEGRD